MSSGCFYYWSCEIVEHVNKQKLTYIMAQQTTKRKTKTCWSLNSSPPFINEH